MQPQVSEEMIVTTRLRCRAYFNTHCPVNDASAEWVDPMALHSTVLCKLQPPEQEFGNTYIHIRMTKNGDVLCGVYPGVVQFLEGGDAAVHGLHIAWLQVERCVTVPQCKRGIARPAT